MGVAHVRVWLLGGLWADHGAGTFARAHTPQSTPTPVHSPPAGGALEDAALAQRLAAAVAAHRIPVLLIAGANDKLVPSLNAVRLAGMLAGSRLAVVEECGHCPQEEQADAFVELVSSFLQGLQAQQQAQQGQVPAPQADAP